MRCAFTRFLAVLCFLAVTTASSLNSRAHYCGVSEITLKVGEQALWHITADRVEVETLYDYLPSLGENSTIFPNFLFWARHGMFMITGKAPGTNYHSIRWSYFPTGAQNICSVKVVVLPADSAQQTDGYLPGYAPTIMTSFYQLDTLLKGRISPQVQMLFIAAQTLGGNLAYSFFQHRLNTLVLSGTSPGQEAHYGGYHDDAARALKPAENATAEDIHRAGTVGASHTTPPRHGDPMSLSLDYKWGEWPTYTGTISPKDYSLEPTTADGDIRRRVVLIYDPKPKSEFVLSEFIRDNTIPSDWGTLREFGSWQDINQIKSNFTGQANTWVRAIGGMPMTMGSGLGKDGFDYSGDYYGLERAIREAGDFLNQDPMHSQFIMFLSGRGGGSALPVVEYAPFQVGEKYRFSDDYRPRLSWSLDSANEFDEPRSVYGDVLLWPRVTFKPLQAQAVDTNLFRLRFEPAQSNPIVFTPNRVRTNDFNADGLINTNSGEGIQVVFRIPADQARLISTNPGSLFLENASGTPYTIRSFRWSLPAGSRSDAPRTISWIDSATRDINGSVTLNLRGNPGDIFALERTTDFASWQLVRNVNFLTDQAQVIDSAASTNRHSSYRLRWINQ